MFDLIFSKLLIKHDFKVLQAYIQYINGQKKLLEIDREVLEKIYQEKLSSFGFSSREARRFYKKNSPVGKEILNDLNACKKEIEDLDNLKKLYLGNTDYYPTTDADYEFIIRYLCKLMCNYNSIEETPMDKKYKKTLQKMRRYDFENIIGRFIYISNKFNVECEFLTYFDQFGKILKDKILSANIYFEKMYDKFLSRGYIDSYLTKENFLSLFINEKELNKAVTKAKQKSLEEKEMKEQLKQEKKLERIIESRKASKVSESKTYKSKKNNIYDDKYSKYIDLTSLELKTNIINIISLDDLLSLLSTMPDMTKNRLAYYKDQYEEMYFEDEVAKVIRLMDKGDQIRIKNSLKNDEVREEIFEFILSDEYKTLNKEDILEFMLNVIKVDTFEQMNNYLIFADDNLLDDEIDRINRYSQDSSDGVVRNVLHQLVLLQTQLLNDLLQTGSDTFHAIKTGGNGLDFELTDSKLRGYRFGKRKSKVCYFKASICKENQLRLQEHYNTTDMSDLLIVFGLGSVLSENEDKLYERCVKQSKDNKDKIEYIQYVLSVPFTDESFKYIIDLIDKANTKLASAKENYKKNNNNELK